MAAGSPVENWIKEENSLLETRDYSNTSNNNIIKEKDKREFNEVEWHIYKKLVCWRHELARKYNKPDFQLINKQSLSALAKNAATGTDWLHMSGIYKKIKTVHYADQVNRLLSESRNEAIELGFSKSRPAQKPLTREEHRKIITEKKTISSLRKVFFDPLKEKIADIHGTETANFIISNRTIADIITGQYGLLENYKKDLFYHYASMLDLDTEAVSELIL
jgi:ribonuclease D